MIRWVELCLCLAGALTTYQGVAASSAPCYDCEMYNIDHKDSLLKERPQRQDQYADQAHRKCKYPCQCDTTELRCKAGVSYIRDGCGCCYLCARQEGDLCDFRSKCDGPKSLYCDYGENKGKNIELGHCRAKSGAECNWMGNIYKDGQSFKPNCSLDCNCQNGQVICTDICSHEQRKPSIHHCRNAILLDVGGQCCRQWMCPHPQSMQNDNDVFQTTTADDIDDIGDCRKETSDWSECSLTCGTGVSVRVTNDNQDCKTDRQTRLCNVRPCDFVELDLFTWTSGHDTSTRRCKHSQRVEFPTTLSDSASCRSVREFRPKYCTLKCHRRYGRCCKPDRSKTLNLEFKCAGSAESQWRKWMWIKSCICDTSYCVDQ